jgi:crotonobetainyl-CoA:carnitine CoA-transferase CaiB-like acyl-CoA transferase
MSILGRLFGNWGAPRADPRQGQEIARDIVARYNGRRLRGEFRVDDKLFTDLCEQLPEDAAREIVTRFKERRARSDAGAEQKLATEIAIAIADACHWRATAHPIMVPATELSAAPDHLRPCNDEDEDAIIFGDYLP